MECASIGEGRSGLDHPWGLSPTAVVQRRIPVAFPGIAPARLGVADENQRLHGATRHRALGATLPAAPDSPTASVEEVPRHVAAVGGDVREHYAVQPDVHPGGVLHQVCRAAQLLRQGLARCGAAMDFEQLQEVDDGGASVEFFQVRLRAILQLRNDVHGGDRLGRRRCNGYVARACECPVPPAVRLPINTAGQLDYPQVAGRAHSSHAWSMLRALSLQ